MKTALFWVVTQRVVVIYYGRFGTTWPQKVWTRGCPEKSVRNYHYSLRNNPEERSSQCQYSLAHTQSVDRGPRAADCTRAPPDSGSHPPCLWALCPRQTRITSIRLLLFWGPGSDLGHISQNHSLSMRSWFEFKFGSKCQLRNLRGVSKSWQLVAEVELTSWTA
jgi:hypothetical protein